MKVSLDFTSRRLYTFRKMVRPNIRLCWLPAATRRLARFITRHCVSDWFSAAIWLYAGIPWAQAERSQFWDEDAGKSRYNLVCGEHAVLGNLAYLAGANLIRWQTWDGIRAIDYLLTRADVDANRISITGTSGGGVQAAYIGALDERIKVVVPSCYISSLPMRAYNRIFADPDSDPEQDPYGMISEGVDHAGLLLLMYPRPIMIASAVLDFFPIEGSPKYVPGNF